MAAVAFLMLELESYGCTQTHGNANPQLETIHVRKSAPDCLAELANVMAPPFKLLMVTSSAAVGTTEHDHLAASCQRPLPPSQLHVAAWAVASVIESAAVSSTRREEQVGTERLSHKVSEA